MMEPKKRRQKSLEESVIDAAVGSAFDWALGRILSGESDSGPSPDSDEKGSDSSDFEPGGGEFGGGGASGEW